MNNPLIIIAVLATFFVIAVVLQVFTLGRINEHLFLIFRELDDYQYKLDNYMTAMRVTNDRIDGSLSKLAELNTLIRKLEEVIKNI